jgi:hypothetical protein
LFYVTHKPQTSLEFACQVNRLLFLHARLAFPVEGVEADVFAERFLEFLGVVISCLAFAGHFFVIEVDVFLLLLLLAFVVVEDGGVHLIHLLFFRIGRLQPAQDVL